MKILVPIKRVVDFNVKVRPLADGSGVDIGNVKMSTNPFCEIAVEEAIRLKEAGVASEVVVVSIGESRCQEQIRSAMALGADRGVLVETSEALNPLDVSKVLVEIVKREAPQLVIMGKQSIDGDNNQTGQMLAALLGWGQGTFASNIEVSSASLDVTREVDGGLQTIRLALPAVVTTDLRLNEPRYAKLPDIMKAKRKPLDITPLDELKISNSESVVITKVEPPAERLAGVKVNSVDELIDKLKTEAKVVS